TITSLAFLILLIPALILCVVTGAFAQISVHPNGVKSLGYLSLLAIFGTAIAVLLFNKLISISSHIFSSAIAYMLPVVAITIGKFDGESFPLINLIWVIIILFGVYLMNKSG